jgi:hypothetical protein
MVPMSLLVNKMLLFVKYTTPHWTVLIPNVGKQNTIANDNILIGKEITLQ